MFLALEQHAPSRRSKVSLTETHVRLLLLGRPTLLCLPSLPLLCPVCITQKESRTRARRALIRHLIVSVHTAKDIGNLGFTLCLGYTTVFFFYSFFVLLNLIDWTVKLAQPAEIDINFVRLELDVRVK